MGAVVGKAHHLGFSFSRRTTIEARFIRLCLHFLYLFGKNLKYLYVTCQILHNFGSKWWARPSLCVFILKELNAAAECKGLASETNRDQRSTSVNRERHGMRHTVSLLSFLHQGLKDNSKCHNKQFTTASQQNFQV